MIRVEEDRVTAGSRVRLAALALLGLAAAALAAVEVPPRPDRYATDRAGVVDAARLSALNETLAQFERETSNQVLVVRRPAAAGRHHDRGVRDDRVQGLGRRPEGQGQRRRVLRVRRRPADAHRGRLRPRGRAAGSPRRQHRRGPREAAVSRERLRRRRHGGRGSDHARRSGRALPGVGPDACRGWPLAGRSAAVLDVAGAAGGAGARRARGAHRRDGVPALDARRRGGEPP